MEKFKYSQRPSGEKVEIQSKAKWRKCRNIVKGQVAEKLKYGQRPSGGTVEI